MPFEAIQLHARRLKQIAVIPSADTSNLEGKNKEDGTWRNFLDFAKLASTLCDDKDLIIFDASSEISNKKGVDFEDAAELADLINLVYQCFYEQGYKDVDIMIDITGGQKVPTIAGASVALAEGRRFQYVSTRDYRVRHYDVTYHGL